MQSKLSEYEQIFSFMSNNWYTASAFVIRILVVATIFICDQDGGLVAVSVLGVRTFEAVIRFSSPM
jgi:hypothetical protein